MEGEAVEVIVLFLRLLYNKADDIDAQILRQAAAERPGLNAQAP